jgi:long-chain acyl-CoA synthetase
MLLQMIAEVSGETPSETGDAARLSEDLRLDSLARVQLQSLLESRLGVEVSDEAIAQVKTLGELRGMVGRGGAAQVVVVGDGQPTLAHDETVREDGALSSLPTSARDKTVREDAAPRSVPSERALPYYRWPWAWPMQVVRAIFLEVIAQPVIWLLGAPRVECAAGKVPDGPMLIVGNHVTAYDGPLILYALPGRVRRRVAIAISAEVLGDLRRGRGQENALTNALAPIGYWLITALYNVFPLPRLRGFRRSFAHAGEAMDRGFSVMIFPEGHRGDGKLQRFREGTGLLAKESQVPVMAVGIRGLGELKASGRWFRTGRLEVRVGEAIELGPGATPAEWTAALESAVRKLIE